MLETLARPRLTFSVGKLYKLRSGAVIRLTKITWLMGAFFFLDGEIVLSPVGESFDGMAKPPRLFWGPDGNYSHGQNDRGEDMPHELDIMGLRVDPVKPKRKVGRWRLRKRAEKK